MAYQALGIAGQFAAILTSLLVLLCLVWLARERFKRTGERLIPAACLAAAALSLLFMFESPAGWVAVGYHLLLGGIFLGLGGTAWRPSVRTGRALALGVSALALLARELYQAVPPVYQAMRLPGPPGFNQAILMAAELLVLLSVAALWGAYGRTKAWRTWITAALPALGLAVFWLVNPSMLGILTIWSVGLTLYLPWPVYALALWMAGMLVLKARKDGNPAGWAVLLLLAGGFNPQLSAQALLGVVALWLLARTEGEGESARRQVPSAEFVIRSL